MDCVLFLANDCNMRCTYCYEGIEKKEILLSKEMMYKSIDFCKELANGKEIDLTLLGGEPLLNRSVFLLLLDYISDDYINISMTTNGTIWDDEILAKIIEKRVSLSISIDGDEKTHLKNRGSKSGINLYWKTMETIRTLLKNNVLFVTRMTVAKNTVTRFFDNIIYFYKMGIKNISVAINEFEEWDDASLFRLDEELSKLDEWYLNHIDEGVFIDLYDAKIGEIMVCRERRFCSAGTKNHFVIDSRGIIYPCSYVVDDPIWEIGNIEMGINESRFREALRQHIVRKKACSDCEINYYCISTRCGFKNYKLTGWINETSINVCKLEKTIFKHNKKVYSTLLASKNSRIMMAYDYLVENGYKLRSI